MTFSRKRGWRDWLRDAFVRQGLFSMRPMPTTPADDAHASTEDPAQKDLIRLNLDADSKGRD